MNALNKGSFFTLLSIVSVSGIISPQLITLTVMFASAAICRNIVRHKGEMLHVSSHDDCIFKNNHFISLSLPYLGFID